MGKAGSKEKTKNSSGGESTKSSNNEGKLEQGQTIAESHHEDDDAANLRTKKERRDKNKGVELDEIDEIGVITATSTETLEVKVVVESVSISKGDEQEVKQDSKDTNAEKLEEMEHSASMKDSVTQKTASVNAKTLEYLYTSLQTLQVMLAEAKSMIQKKEEQLSLEISNRTALLEQLTQPQRTETSSQYQSNQKHTVDGNIDEQEWDQIEVQTVVGKQMFKRRKKKAVPTITFSSNHVPYAAHAINCLAGGNAVFQSGQESKLELDSNRLQGISIDRFLARIHPGIVEYDSNPLTFAQNEETIELIKSLCFGALSESFDNIEELMDSKNEFLFGNQLFLADLKLWQEIQLLGVFPDVSSTKYPKFGRWLHKMNQICHQTLTAFAPDKSFSDQNK